MQRDRVIHIHAGIFTKSVPCAADKITSPQYAFYVAQKMREARVPGFFLFHCGVAK